MQGLSQQTWRCSAWGSVCGERQDVQKGDDAVSMWTCLLQAEAGKEAGARYEDVHGHSARYRSGAESFL